MSPEPRQSNRRLTFTLVTAVLFLVTGVWPVTHYFSVHYHISHLFEYTIAENAPLEKVDWDGFLNQEQENLLDLARSENASLAEHLEFGRKSHESSGKLYLELSCDHSSRLPALDDYHKRIIRGYRSYAANLECERAVQASTSDLTYRDEELAVNLQKARDRDLDLLKQSRQKVSELKAQYDQLITRIATLEQQLWDKKHERFAKFAQGLSRPKDMLWQAYQQQIRREIKLLQKDQAAFPDQKAALREEEKVCSENIIDKVNQLKSLEVKPPPRLDVVPKLDFDWTMQSKRSYPWQWVIFVGLALFGGLVGWLIEKLDGSGLSLQNKSSSKSESILFSEPIVMKSASLRESSDFAVAADEAIATKQGGAPYLASHMETLNQHVAIEELEDPSEEQVPKPPRNPLDEVEPSAVTEILFDKITNRTNDSANSVAAEPVTAAGREQPPKSPIEELVPSSETESLVDKFLGKPKASPDTDNGEVPVLPDKSTRQSELEPESSTTRGSNSAAQENTFDTAAEPGQLQQCEPFSTAIETLREHTSCPVILISALKPDQASPRFAADLAILMQRRRRRVLLVEADADSHVLAEKVFGVATEPGFYQWRCGEAWVGQVSSETHLRDVTFMPAGAVSTEQGVADLDLDKETHRWANLKNNYDVVLLYCPSALLPKPRTPQQHAASHLRHLIDGLFALTGANNTAKMEKQLQTHYPHLKSQLLSVVTIK